MLTEEYIIAVYCLVDEILKKVKKSKLRQRGPQPKLSDAEVITMEIVGESKGFDKDKYIHHYFKDHWLHLFPGIGNRTTFLRQAANLWAIKQEIRKSVVQKILPFGSELSIIDGFPIPVCGFRRAHFSKLFKGNAEFGHCAAKDLRYFGFKGHLLVDEHGLILDCAVAAANIDEREMIFDMSSEVASDLLGDKGYICSEIRKEEFQNEGINIHTPLRGNMKDDRPKEFVKMINDKRRLVETVIGQLSERFNIEKVRARDMWHLTVRIGRKLLAHTINCFINYTLGNSILQFEKIVP
jgi:hypothetical protein